MDITSDPQHQDRYEALLDPVTRLPGAVLLHDRLEVALAHARRVRRSVAVLAVDVHAVLVLADDSARDVMVQRITERLCESIRADDTVARTGVDRFIVVCNDIMVADDLPFIARCLRQAVERLADPDGSAVSVPVVGTLGGSDSTAAQLLDEIVPERGRSRGSRRAHLAAS